MESTLPARGSFLCEVQFGDVCSSTGMACMCWGHAVPTYAGGERRDLAHFQLSDHMDIWIVLAFIMSLLANMNKFAEMISKLLS